MAEDHDDVESELGSLVSQRPDGQIEGRFKDLIVGPIFAQRLQPKQISAALQQAAVGLMEFKRVRDVLEQLCENDRNHSFKAQTLITKELNFFTGKDRDEKLEDKMEGTRTGWISFLKSYEKLNQVRALSSRKFNEKILSIATKFYDSQLKSYESIKTKLETCLSNLEYMQKKLNKKHAKALKMIQDMQARDESKGGLKQAFKDMTKASNWKKVLEMSREYDDQVMVVNQAYQIVYKRELPKLFSQIQQLEEQRILTIQLILDNGFGWYKISMRESINLSEHFYKCSATIDVFQDLHKTHDMKGPGIEKFFSYQLPMSLKEIESKTFSTSTKPPFDLTASPEQIVEQQKKLFPTMDLKLPRIFTVLRRAIEDLGGLEKEGIFRISAEFSAVDNTYNRIRAGDYEVEITNPHVAACCLKKWLRELSDPLIPVSCTDELMCVLEKGDDSECQSALKKVLDQLGPVTRMVIKGMIKMIRDISMEENQKHTLMTVGNLGVVFSPSFIHIPDGLSNPLEAFKYAEFGSEIVHLLTLIVDSSDYPVDEELLAASPLVTPVQVRTHWKHATDIVAPRTFSKSRGRPSETKQESEEHDRSSEITSSVMPGKIVDVTSETSTQQITADPSNEQGHMLEGYLSKDHGSGSFDPYAELPVRVSTPVIPAVQDIGIKKPTGKICPKCYTKVKSGTFCFECWLPVPEDTHAAMQ